MLSEGRAEERASEGNAKSSLASKTQARLQATSLISLFFFPTSIPLTYLHLSLIATLSGCLLHLKSDQISLRAHEKGTRSPQSPTK
jgi:hypothetical protein